MTLPPIIFAVLLAWVAAQPSSQALESKRAAATFVFLGTVASATSTAPTSAEARSVLVVVNQVYLQKGKFEDQTGRQVEVVGAPTPLKEKSQYVFYTDPVRFGERVAVTVVDVSTASESAAGQQAAAMKQQVAEAAQRREIEERAALAELVISGVVTDVRQLERPARDTEHDPDFRVARLKVERALKGKPAGGEIEFVFANSKDVQWFQSPKFRVGDRGVLFLQRPTQDVAPLVANRVRFTLLNPLDYRPARDLQAVEAVLKAVRQ